MPGTDLKHTKQFTNEKWEEFTKRIENYFQSICSEIEKFKEQISELQMLQNVINNGENDFIKILDNSELLIKYNSILNRYISAMESFRLDSKNLYAHEIAKRIVNDSKLLEKIKKVEDLKKIFEQLTIEYKELSELMKTFQTKEYKLELIEKIY